MSTRTSKHLGRTGREENPTISSISWIGIQKSLCTIRATKGCLASPISAVLWQEGMPPFLFSLSVSSVYFRDERLLMGCRTQKYPKTGSSIQIRFLDSYGKNVSATWFQVSPINKSIKAEVNKSNSNHFSKLLQLAIKLFLPMCFPAWQEVWGGEPNSGSRACLCVHVNGEISFFIPLPTIQRLNFLRL